MRYSKLFCFLMLLGAFSEMYASQPLRRARTLTTTAAEKVEVWKMGDAQYSWYESRDGRCWNMESRSRQLSVCPASEVRTFRGERTSRADGLGFSGISDWAVVPSIGDCRIPVIMVAYSDLDFLPETTPEKLSRYFNEVGYADENLARGSVVDYFHGCSYGKFRPKFDVVGKVTLPRDYKYYGAHEGTRNDAHVIDLVNEAVQLAVEQGIDFSAYATDGKAPIVSIVHAGPGEHEDYGDDCDDYVWAHFRAMKVPAGAVNFSSYIINNETIRYFQNGEVKREVMTGIGTFCHEFSHALGLPDIYDVDGSINGEGETPGYWDIMDYQFMHDGYRPTSYSAYERAMLKWLEIPELTAEGSCVLSPLDDEPEGESVQAVRIVNPQNPAEYFILENRRRSTFYISSLLGEGMLVWHVDYDADAWNRNIVNADAGLQRVQVVPADGQWQSVGDLFLTDADKKPYTYTGDIFPGYRNVTTFNAAVGTYHTGDFGDVVSNIRVLDDGRVAFDYVKPTGIGKVTTELGKTGAFYGIDGRKQKAEPTRGLYIQGGSVRLK